jgi:uncharacterized radical SAM superfamily protein
MTNESDNEKLKLAQSEIIKGKIAADNDVIKAINKSNKKHAKMLNKLSVNPPD